MSFLTLEGTVCKIYLNSNSTKCASSFYIFNLKTKRIGPSGIVVMTILVIVYFQTPSSGQNVISLFFDNFFYTFASI